MIVTIDGPSGTGKSTVARAVAQQLDIMYFDTGAMYRSFTYAVLQSGIDIEDPAQLNSLLDSFRYDIRLEDGTKHYFVGEEDVTTAIRSREVTGEVSRVAAVGEVRRRLVDTQRSFAEHADAVFEGRDIGTVVFPNAEAKIFLTASAEERAQRRYRELTTTLSAEELAKLSVEKIKDDIEQRDHKDSTREVSPLRQAEDALLVDTSDMSIDEVVERIVEHVQSHSKS